MLGMSFILSDFKKSFNKYLSSKNTRLEDTTCILEVLKYVKLHNYLFPEVREEELETFNYNLEIIRKGKRGVDEDSLNNMSVIISDLTTCIEEKLPDYKRL